MSKRAADPLWVTEKQKRKRLSLPIVQILELLQKLGRIRRLTEDYGVGMTTIYDLKKQKD